MTAGAEWCQLNTCKWISENLLLLKANTQNATGESSKEKAVNKTFGSPATQCVPWTTSRPAGLNFNMQKVPYRGK